MASDLAREALEPIAKAASILTDDGGWRETDVLELIAENGDREYVGSLTVRDLRRARTAYDAMGSRVKALIERARVATNSAVFSDEDPQAVVDWAEEAYASGLSRLSNCSGR